MGIVPHTFIIYNVNCCQETPVNWGDNDLHGKIKSAVDGERLSFDSDATSPAEREKIN